jgi:hypothetical protein
MPRDDEGDRCRPGWCFLVHGGHGGAPMDHLRQEGTLEYLVKRLGWYLRAGCVEGGRVV